MLIRVKILLAFIFVLAISSQALSSAPTQPAARPQTAPAVEDPQAAYDRQLAEYNAAVEQQKKWALEQEARERQFRIVTIAAAIAASAFVLIWTVRRNSRVTGSALAKADESLLQNQRLIQQNDRIIELLKSINDRLEKKTE